MENVNKKVPEIFMQRTNKLMAERFLSKKDMAERLNMEYLTFWRKLNGKRGVDMVLLVQIAQVLGTTVAYLLGETDSPLPSLSQKDGQAEGVVIKMNDGSREIHSNPGHLIFRSGEISIDMPDTPMNKKIFDDFLTQVLSMSVSKEQSVTVTA